MTKRLVLWIVLMSLVFTAGCDQLKLFAPQDATVVLSDSEAATLAALAAETQKPSDGILRLPTPTTFDPQLVKPSSTPKPGSITITSIMETGPGRALVNWDAIGEFPSGFKVVWTDVQGKPTFPENTSVYASGPNARSALINGKSGTIYYVRVCRYLNGICDIYSELGIFAFLDTSSPTPDKASAATATMLAFIQTKTAIPGGITGGTTGTSLVITSMSGGATGKAYMAWTAEGSFPLGYKIVYSKTNTKPTYGTDPYFYVRDSAARYAYVDGDPGSKYYYRICRYITSGCDTYSPVYTHTFTGTAFTPTPDPAVITITGITDTTTGLARVDWTATGSFPTGFKIVYSKTNPLPTLADTNVYVSDGSLRTGTVTGDPSGAYYFRVCKYYNGKCVVYSPAVSFTFAADPAVISITGITDTTLGSATINWDATGTFPNGFKILYSTTQPVPTFENASKITVSDGSLRTASVTGIPNTLYYYRVCKYTGSGCSVYSAVSEFTYADAPVDAGFVLALSSVTLTQADFSWTLAVDNPGGYKAMWSFSNPPPWPGSSSEFISSPTARTYVNTSLTSGGTYYVRLCKWNGSYCTAYSNTVEVVVP